MGSGLMISTVRCRGDNGATHPDIGVCKVGLDQGLRETEIA